MTILVVEDEIEISQFVQEGLEMEHYTVDVAYDGDEGLEKVEINSYDVIVLDILLPKMDGITVCKKIREKNIDTPIIMLTAKDTVEDRVRGLDAGSDDYLVKPFKFEELIARIRALLRREKIVNVGVLQVGDLTLDPASHEVRRAGVEIGLSSKEYRILDYMMRRPGRVCTRTMLGEHVWGYDFLSKKSSNVIDAYISYLRKKIHRGTSKKLIYTIHDVGYKIQDKDESVRGHNDFNQE